MSDEQIRLAIHAFLGSDSMSDCWAEVKPLIDADRQAAFECGRQAGLEQAAQHRYSRYMLGIFCSCGWRCQMTETDCSVERGYKLFADHIRSLAQPAASAPAPQVEADGWVTILIQETGRSFRVPADEVARFGQEPAASAPQCTGSYAPIESCPVHASAGSREGQPQKSLNQRGWDLLRQMRHELFNEQLITQDEYTYLLTEIKGSVKRLEDYDKVMAKGPTESPLATLLAIAIRVPHHWWDRYSAGHYAYSLVADQDWQHDEQCARCELDKVLAAAGGTGR